MGFALGADEAFDELIAQIRAVGPEHVILSSDLGQPGNPSHVEGLTQFIERARAAGFSDGELDRMLRRNPARLLGLD